MNKKIEIIYTEDQPLFRKNLITLLKEHDIDCIGEAGNGKELIKLLERGKRPDVLLLDLQMPKMDGNTVLKILKTEYPYIKIVILTGFEDDVLKNDFRAKGVNAFVTKSIDLMEVVTVIRNVHESSSYRNLEKDLKTNFTKREIQIIPLICKEKNNREIANIIGLKEKSVESARKRLYEKTGCKSTAGFVNFCTKEGLDNLGSPLIQVN